VSLTTSEARSRLYQKVRACLESEFGANVALNLHSWLVNYKANPSFLYQVYDLLSSSAIKELTDDRSHLTFVAYPDQLVVKTVGGDKTFPLPVARRALQLVSDALEDYLPLGSVVDLKKEHFSNILDIDSIETLRVVITQRLVPPPDAETFFSYGAVVYPIGVFEGNKSIYFTPSLIDSVVYRGYSDEVEHAFIFAMVDELVFNRSYCSIVFAGKDIQQRAQRAQAARQPQQSQNTGGAA
jgi:hypothetical protein